MPREIDQYEHTDKTRRNNPPVGLATGEAPKAMYLSIVEIKNFRSLQELRVEFQPGLNVIVGRNNTGKTNLLQAIRHALGPGATRGDALWLDRDDFYRESKDEADRVMSVTLTFAQLSKDQRAHFFEIVDFDTADIANSKAIIRFEASWSEGKQRASIKRTGGPVATDTPEVPTALLQSLPVTFLPALRDAEAFLTPGVRSRLGRLLYDLAKRQKGNGSNVKADIEGIYSKANAELERHELIKDTRVSLQSTTKDLAGSDYLASAISVAEVDFKRILRSLQVQMDGLPIGSLDANGLGYNNLLYMAVVLEHLKSPDADECPLLLVEEPEAHLHPQLTTLLADYLAHKTPGTSTPQTIVTTHSPTLAAAIPPSQVHVMCIDTGTQRPTCHSIVDAGMDEREQRALQRMMDITRATLYFAKAAILVEGISESLLVPVLARRLGRDLSSLHISVIPICGVAFETFKKLLQPSVVGIPVAIVTDSDPPVDRGQTWEGDRPQKQGIEFCISDRVTKLLDLFEGHSSVKVFRSTVTLEYDLADAGDQNATVMAEVWESCFVGAPKTLTQGRVNDAGPLRSDKAMAVWRGICRAEHSGSKAEFAHRLAAHLSEQDKAKHVHAFEIPDYLRDAITYVVENVPSAPTAGVDGT